MRFLEDLKPLNRDLENFTDTALDRLSNLPYNYLYILAAVVLLLVL